MEECNYCGVNIDNGTNSCDNCKDMMNGEDNKKYYLNDLESGEYYEVSKEKFEQYHNMLQSIIPIVNGEAEGIMFIISTSGDFDGINIYKEMWTESMAYKTINWNSEDWNSEIQRNYKYIIGTDPYELEE